MAEQFLANLRWIVEGEDPSEHDHSPEKGCSYCCDCNDCIAYRAQSLYEQEQEGR